MKKNLALTLAIIVLAALFVSCASNNGTYYLYENGERSGESFITIKDDEWTDNHGASGRVEIENDKITFYTVVFGSEEELWSGTIKDGTITLSYKILETEFTYEYRLEK